MGKRRNPSNIQNPKVSPYMDEILLKNDPLTLEELRKMDGEWVWVEKCREWFLISLHHSDFGECGVNKDGLWLNLKQMVQRGSYRNCI